MSQLYFLSFALGCKVNQYDTALLAKELLNRGFKLSKTNPDLVIINTCAVTKKAITKDRQVFHKLKNRYPQAQFLIMGCWPQTDQDIEEEAGVIFWGVGDNPGLIKKLVEVFPQLAPVPVSESGLLVPSDKSRYFLKVGDGCNQFCTYCLIPYARGRITSRPQADLVAEVKEAIVAGYGEIVLSGIHLGRYGEDLGGHISLVSLLQSLLALPGLGRLRLSSIEINEVDDALIALMKNNSQICQHLHISLQSGSDKILKAMNRPYNTAYFRERVLRLREAMPLVAISTDIIVGFPGETAADFETTYKFAAELQFSKIHVFPFSAHEKTAAYKLTGRVNPVEKKERAVRLRSLSSQLESQYQENTLKNLAGQLIKVVPEKIRTVWYGKTEYHFDVVLTDYQDEKGVFLYDYQVPRGDIVSYRQNH